MIFHQLHSCWQLDKGSESNISLDDERRKGYFKEKNTATGNEKLNLKEKNINKSKNKGKNKYKEKNKYGYQKEIETVNNDIDEDISNERVLENNKG